MCSTKCLFFSKRNCQESRRAVDSAYSIHCANASLVLNRPLFARAGDLTQDGTASRALLVARIPPSLAHELRRRLLFLPEAKLLVLVGISAKQGGHVAWMALCPHQLSHVCGVPGHEAEGMMIAQLILGWPRRCLQRNGFGVFPTSDSDGKLDTRRRTRRRVNFLLPAFGSYSCTVVPRRSESWAITGDEHF